MMPRLALLAAILGCFPSTLLGQVPAPDPSEPDVLRGVVLNSLTHEPVARVLVHSPDNRFAVLTDDRGHFQFTFASAQAAVAPSGQPVAAVRPYELWLRKPGFLSRDGEQRFPVNPSQHEVTFAIIPEALIVGRVNRPPGAGDATVEIFRRKVSDGRERWESAGTVNARSNGDFRFADLTAGAYKIFTHEITENDPLTFDPAKQFGFPPVYFPASVDFSAAAVIDLSPGQTFQASLTPARRQYYQVRVRVLNVPANGGSQVEVYPQAHPGPGYSLGYNFNDQVIEGALPDGLYTVQLSSFGPAAMSGETNLTVGPGASVPTLVMLPNPSLTVRVKNEMQQSYGFGQSAQRTDSPAPPPSLAQEYMHYFQLQLLSDSGFGNSRQYQYPAHPPNDPEAEFLVIDGVHPGRYRVRANSAGLGYVASVMSGEIDLLHEPLVVTPGASLPPLEVTLRDDGAEIQGEVDRAGGPINAASSSSPGGLVLFPRPSAPTSPGFVYFVPTTDSTGQFREFWINSDGRFDAQQIPPGEYLVLATPKSYPELEFASEESLRKFESQSQRLTISAGQKQKVRLSLITEEQP